MRTQVFIVRVLLSFLVIGGPCADQVYAFEGVQPEAGTSWDLKSQLPKDFFAKPNYLPAYANGPGKLLGDGVQRDAFDLQMKSSIPGGLKGEFQMGQSMANSQAERLFQNQNNQLM